MDCQLLATCAFFNDRMADMPSTAERFKQIYCRGDFDSCARYTIVKAIGREKVPADLFPNQQDRAKAIIAQQ